MKSIILAPTADALVKLAGSGTHKSLRIAISRRLKTFFD